MAGCVFGRISCNHTVHRQPVKPKGISLTRDFVETSEENHHSLLSSIKAHLCLNLITNSNQSFNERVNQNGEL